MGGALSSLVSIADAAVFNSTGLLFVVAGVFLLVRATGFPDLTVDGSFTVGAALYSVCLAGGRGVSMALLIAVAGGAAGGSLTWLINQKLGVGKVISGVLSMIILVLAAPYLSGGSTKGLLHVESVVTQLEALDSRWSTRLVGAAPFGLHIITSSVLLCLFAIVGSVIYSTLKTRFGLRLRYVGSASAPTLVSSAEQARLRLFGLACGNALVALGGAVEAQRRGGYTNNMGTGMILVALAVLILGEALIKSYRKREFLWLSEYARAIVIGTLLYSVAIQGLLAAQIQIVDIRLLTAVFLLVLLGVAGRAHSSSTRLF